jgi:hypothetical protein
MCRPEAADPKGSAGAPEYEITPAMAEAGESEVLAVVGGADLGGWFSAHALAKRVYLAMRAEDLSVRDP